jgi:ribosomal-protein-alanine N-acetyltransferase
MSAVLLESAEAAFEPLVAARLPEVLAIEQAAYEHPWSVTNFRDALKSGYQAQLLTAGGTVLGYFVAMKGVDEVHLLNITVAPAFQRQGWARVMLDALALWARAQGVQWLWLEARVSNLRAVQVYEAHGYRRVGRVACGLAGLGDHVLHVAWCEELALLDVDRLAAARHRVDEIGLAAQEGRGLQHVDHGGHGRDLCLAVHVRQDGHVQLAPHLGQDLQPALHARAAERGAAGAVGLVVAGLEDERNAQLAGDFLQAAGDVHLKLLALDHTGAGDQEERLVEADVEPTQLHAAAFWPSAWCAKAALM